MSNIKQTLKFFSPLSITAYHSHEYGGCGADDMLEELSQAEAVYYMDEILEAIEKEKLPDEGQRGLMVYFDRDKALAEKVYSTHPTVEEYNGELWSVMVVEVYGELTESEMSILADYFTGQYSDGWGEGFEQRGIKIHCGEIYVSFWDSKNFFIKPERELKQENEQIICEQTIGGM
jgi:hypothetical protein